MQFLLEQSLAAGSFGLSSGLVYPPGVYASAEELTHLLHLVSRYGGIYATHLRSEGDKIEEAIAEALLVAEKARVSLQIAHLKTYGKRNWPKLPAAFQLIENARKRGLSVHADRYPYTASFTDLDVLLPPWVWEKGAQHELALLADPKARKKMTREILLINPEADFWQQVVIATVKSNQNRFAEGKSLARLADQKKQEPWEVLYDLLLDEALQITAVFFAMSDENLSKVLAKDYVMVGTDSAARSLSPVREEGKPHPRAFGTYPRILRKWAGPNKALSLEQAIYMMTGLPAQKLGLQDRGSIQSGYFADLVVFDPAAVRDLADYENPFQASEGIEQVFINGNLVWAEQTRTGKRPGKIIRKA
jgi:N-acyl-D-amino-acid deacylase